MCGKSISHTIHCVMRVTYYFSPNFYVICDLTLNRSMATWSQLIKYLMWNNPQSSTVYDMLATYLRYQCFPQYID